MPRLTAQDVANFFLALEDEDCGDTMSNLKLQKLLYYAQGYHLALKQEPLFDEPIFAWQHGPVVPAIYYHYRDCGSSALPKPQNIDDDIYDREARDFLTEIYNVFGQFSAWKLRNMTHEEPPWRDTPPNNQISLKRMQDYFATQIES